MFVFYSFFFVLHFLRLIHQSSRQMHPSHRRKRRHCRVQWNCLGLLSTFQSCRTSRVNYDGSPRINRSWILFSTLFGVPHTPPYLFLFSIDLIKTQYVKRSTDVVSPWFVTNLYYLFRGQWVIKSFYKALIKELQIYLFTILELWRGLLHRQFCQHQLHNVVEINLLFTINYKHTGFPK